MEKDYIPIDEEGLQQILDEIKKLEEQLANNKRARGEFLVAGCPDRTRDLSLQDLDNQRGMLEFRLRQKKDMLLKIKVVEKMKDTDTVNIGDTVQVKLVTTCEGESLEENLRLKLVGVDNGDNDTDAITVDLNSPIGRCIHQQKVGSNLSYSVGEKIFNVTIKEKVLTVDEQKDSKPKTKTKQK